ncbi:MAG: type II toxin-antitoxin system Phd/YefM family antitoxin [Planctomycetota bacterium]
MKDIVVSKSIVPLGEFKARAAQYLKEAAGSGRPLVITQNGRPAAVLLSPEEFDRIRERERFLESIAAGREDADAGRVMDTETVHHRLAKRRARRGAAE